MLCVSAHDSYACSRCSEYCLSLDIHVVDFGAHLLAMLLALVQHDVLRTMNGQHQIAYVSFY